MSLYIVAALAVLRCLCRSERRLLLLLLLFNTTLLLLSIYIQAPGLTPDMSAAFTSYMVNIDFELGKVIRCTTPESKPANVLD